MNTAIKKLIVANYLHQLAFLLTIFNSSFCWSVGNTVWCGSPEKPSVIPCDLIGKPQTYLCPTGFSSPVVRNRLNKTGAGGRWGCSFDRRLHKRCKMDAYKSQVFRGLEGWRQCPLFIIVVLNSDWTLEPPGEIFKSSDACAGPHSHSFWFSWPGEGPGH